MSKTNANDAAMPTSDFLYPDGSIEHGNTGLTKREHFAAMAMQGLLTYVADGFENTSITRETIASDAVKMADALIAELNKNNLT